MATESDYWKQFWRKKVNRRRLIKVSAIGGAGLAAAGVVGCGDDDDAGNGGTPTATGAGSPTGAASPTGEATPKAGGSWRGPMVGLSTGNPPSLDAHTQLSFLAQIPANYCYSRLIKAAPPEYGEIDGVPSVPIDFSSVEGDGAESIPEMVDETTFVFTLRDNLNFHDVAPVSARAVTADDVKASIDSFAASSPNRGNWLTYVEGVEVTGEKTLTINMRQPFGPALTVLFGNNDGGPYIYPQELVDDPDSAARNPIGSGPWVFQEWQDDTVIRWRKNPDWYDAPRPYLDEVESALISDPDTILENVRNGTFDSTLWSAQIWDSAMSELSEDFQFFTGPEHVWGGAYFNFAVPPFNDVRVRQALSMAVDRPGLLSVLDQPGAVGGGGGLTHISQYAGFYIDPINDEETFGPNAKYFKRDVQGARDLLAQAGYENGLQISAQTSSVYGAGYSAMMEGFGDSASEAGFDFEYNYQEYPAYISTTYYGDLAENQMGLAPLQGSPMDPHNIFFRVMHPTSVLRNYGPRTDQEGRMGIPADQLPIDGDAGPAGDAALLKLWSDQAAATDLDERTEIIHDIQRHMAERMYFVPWTGVSTAYIFAPYVRGIRFTRGYAFGTEGLPNIWLDK